MTYKYEKAMQLVKQKKANGDIHPAVVAGGALALAGLLGAAKALQPELYNQPGVGGSGWPKYQ